MAHSGKIAGKVLEYDLSQIQATKAIVRNITKLDYSLTSIAHFIILPALSIESSTYSSFRDWTKSTWYISGDLDWLGGVPSAVKLVSLEADLSTLLSCTTPDILLEHLVPSGSPPPQDHPSEPQDELYNHSG